jgi:hypothetical protein
MVWKGWKVVTWPLCHTKQDDHHRAISAEMEMGRRSLYLGLFRSCLFIRTGVSRLQLSFVRTIALEVAMDEKTVCLITLGLFLAVMMVVFVGLLPSMRLRHRQDSSPVYTSLRPMTGEFLKLSPEYQWVSLMCTRQVVRNQIPSLCPHHLRSMRVSITIPNGSSTMTPEGGSATLLHHLFSRNVKENVTRGQLSSQFNHPNKPNTRTLEPFGPASELCTLGPVQPRDRKGPYPFTDLIQGPHERHE